MKLPLRIIVLLALPISFAAAADVTLKPGTYRVQTEIQVSGQAKPTATTEEDCLTEAEAKQAHTLLLRELATSDDDCKNTIVNSVGGRVTFEMRCKDVDGATAETKGEMNIGGDWYKADLTSKVDGDVIKVKVDAKWVRAGCTAGK